MVKLTLSDISLADIKQLVKLKEKAGTEHGWTQVEAIKLTENEQRQVQDIRARLINTQVHLFNQATVWSRAIYPLTSTCVSTEYPCFLKTLVQ